MENQVIELKHAEKWKDTLNKCIRCGYCYEHCPLIKHTRWESDAPRAKLIMIYGMLSGNLEPSKYIGEKLFSCFYCKRCEAACSAGVPLTDVFSDVRKDFVGTEFEAVGTTAVTGENCVLCLACVRACPHEARLLVDGEIVTDMVKCESCGICLDVCPNKCITIENAYGTDSDSLNSEIQDFLGKKNSKAIVFGCNWSFYPGLQTAEISDCDSCESESSDKEYKILINLCGGRLSKTQLIEPLLNGAWGVLVACCPDGECEHDGNLKAKAQVKILRDLFKEMEINPDRIQLVQIAHGDKTGFQAAIDEFMEKINELGPMNA